MTLAQYIPLLAFFGSPTLLTLALAVPVARRTRSWLRFLGACLQIIIGMGLPLLSFWQARRIFQGLPDTPPDCFVVTAASRFASWPMP